MTTPDRNPFDSAAPQLSASFPPDSEIGRLVRRGDARWRLAEMAAAEPEVRRQEQAQAAIDDRLTRIQVEHAWNIQYLIRFGVAASQRAAFQQILEEVSIDGGYTLREAADRVGVQKASSESATAQEIHRFTGKENRRLTVVPVAMPPPVRRLPG